MNSFKRVRAFQIELEFGSVGFLRRGENRITRRKTSRSKGENHQQTQPTYGVDAGSRTRATLVGGERSHHCAVPCSQNGSRELAPQVDQNGNAYISFYIGAKGQKRTNLKTISENIAGQVFVACA